MTKYDIAVVVQFLDTDRRSGNDRLDNTMDIQIFDSEEDARAEALDIVCIHDMRLIAPSSWTSWDPRKKVQDDITVTCRLLMVPHWPAGVNEE